MKKVILLVFLYFLVVGCSIGQIKSETYIEIEFHSVFNDTCIDTILINKLDSKEGREFIEMMNRIHNKSGDFLEINNDTVYSYSYFELLSNDTIFEKRRGRLYGEKIKFDDGDSLLIIKDKNCIFSSDDGTSFSIYKNIKVKELSLYTTKELLDILRKLSDKFNIYLKVCN